MAADPSLSPELIQAQAFSSGFRGYDQSEVRDFLSRVATEVRALRDRADQLESAWHSAEERAARPPVLDEDTLMDAVGEETASILRAARSAAADLRTRAAQEMERMTADAEARAEQIRAEAEVVLARQTTVAEQAASRVVESARAEAAEMVDKARVEADAVRAAAQQERTLTIDGAIATRERVLDDLARRRRVASVQIEQLRAGRERLLESYGVVRRTLEEVNDELNRADAEARAAADEVGRRMQRDYHPEPIVAEEDRPDDPAATGPSDLPPDAEAGSEPSASAEVAPATEKAVEPAIVAPRGSPVPTSSASAKRGGPGGASVGAKALATAVDHPQEAAIPAEVATVPHLRVVPDATAGVLDQEASPPGSQVDVLFARIRSGRIETPLESEPVAPDATTATPPAETPDDAETEMEPTVSTGDERLLQRREAVLGDFESSLTRKLKRTMQDEQNDLLDRLRSLRGEPTVARLLPDLSSQVVRYADVARPHVDSSAAAGVAFAVEILERKGRARAGVPVVADLATEAATTIVESLRRRLEHAISASAGDEQAVLIEAVGAAYREWKSERIERVAGDVLAAAFSRGTWHEVPDDTPVRWVVEDTDGPCPDCDDDALAGHLPKGEAFPTGQLHPPAHPGCRCLLVPVAE